MPFATLATPSSFEHASRRPLRQGPKGDALVSARERAQDRRLQASLGKNSKMRRRWANNPRSGCDASWLRRAFVACFLGLAHVGQLAAGAVPASNVASPSESAALALSAAIGKTAVLCGKGAGDLGAPSHGAPCCNDCTLCHGAGCSTALAVASVVWRALPQSAALAPAPRESQPVPRLLPTSEARSRAPPIPV
jgi:hypothetical protein